VALRSECLVSDPPPPPVLRAPNTKSYRELSAGVSVVHCRWLATEMGFQRAQRELWKWDTRVHIESSHAHSGGIVEWLRRHLACHRLPFQS
jgi:hypothetical protein